jgi:hypothetical protein
MDFARYALNTDQADSVKFITVPDAAFRFVAGVGKNHKPFYGYELYIPGASSTGRPFMGFFTLQSDRDFLQLLVNKWKLVVKFQNIAGNDLPEGFDYSQVADAEA